MRDMMGMMKQAKELQAKMQAMQEEIANLEATASSGGGLVTITLSGKGTLSSLRIDPSLAKEDEVEILEDLIIAAHNDAKAKLEAEVEKLGSNGGRITVLRVLEDPSLYMKAVTDEIELTRFQGVMILMRQMSTHKTGPASLS